RRPSAGLCARLPGREKVAAVPGIAFGADDYTRLSYATGLVNIEQGLEPMGRFVQRLAKQGRGKIQAPSSQAPEMLQAPSSNTESPALESGAWNLFGTWTLGLELNPRLPFLQLRHLRGGDALRASRQPLP
ncbi:MAG: hypothetical protein ACKVYV_16300, partial [Limisphaerales bacterium]